MLEPQRIWWARPRKLCALERPGGGGRSHRPERRAGEIEYLKERGVRLVVSLHADAPQPGRLRGRGARLAPRAGRADGRRDGGARGAAGAAAARAAGEPGAVAMHGNRRTDFVAAVCAAHLHEARGEDPAAALAAAAGAGLDVDAEACRLVGVDPAEVELRLSASISAASDSATATGAGSAAAASRSSWPPAFNERRVELGASRPRRGRRRARSPTTSVAALAEPVERGQDQLRLGLADDLGAVARSRLHRGEEGAGARPEAVRLGVGGVAPRGHEIGAPAHRERRRCAGRRRRSPPCRPRSRPRRARPGRCRSAPSARRRPRASCSAGVPITNAVRPLARLGQQVLESRRRRSRRRAATPACRCSTACVT